jgi:RNA polymerase sigma factor (sigma-70 family)
LLLRIGMEHIERDDIVAGLVNLRPMLIKQAFVLTKNHADAEDLVHTAFERALRRREGFWPKTHLRAWFCKVVRHLAVDRVRHPSHSRRICAEVADLPQSEPEPSLYNWWMGLDTEDIRRALTSCSPVLRGTFEMYHFGGLSLEAISKMTNVPINTLSTRMFRARAHLRRTLQLFAPVGADEPSAGRLPEGPSRRRSRHADALP